MSGSSGYEPGVNGSPDPGPQRSTRLRFVVSSSLFGRWDPEHLVSPGSVVAGAAENGALSAPRQAFRGGWLAPLPSSATCTPAQPLQERERWWLFGTPERRRPNPLCDGCRRGQPAARQHPTQPQPTSPTPARASRPSPSTRNRAEGNNRSTPHGKMEEGGDR